MWSGQQFCWTMTNRLSDCVFGISFCSCLVTASLPIIICYMPSWSYMSFCFCAHMANVARRLGCMHERQVRHVAGTRRFLEQAHLSVTLDHRCVCLNTSVCQLSSACRGSGVYSFSLLLLGLTCFPVASGPASQARQKSSAIRFKLGLPGLSFVQKLNVFYWSKIKEYKMLPVLYIHKCIWFRNYYFGILLLDFTVSCGQMIPSSDQFRSICGNETTKN